MSKELHPTIKDIVPAVANAIARKFRGWVEPDDLRQELYVWALARQDHYKDQFDEEHKEKREHNERRFAFQMRRVAEKYARREKARKAGYHPSDEAFYDTATIAQLMPSILQSVIEGTVLEQAQELINDGTPRKQPAPAEGGNLLAILIDVKRAYLKLDQEDQAILRLRYYENATLQQVAQFLECATSTADRRCTTSLRRLQDLLGGDTPWQ